MAHNAASIFLQKIYASMTPHFQLQALSAHSQLQTPQRIDGLVAAEMHRLRANYALDEEHFVQQMMRENPVIVERRNLTTSGSGSGSGSGTDDQPQQDQSQQQQRLRAESCRKSRINNKIKKAKTKFRHKFVTSKLAQSSQMLECMRNVIAQAEAQLLGAGSTIVQLQQLRANFGVDKGACRQLGDVVVSLGGVTPKRRD